MAHDKSLHEGTEAAVPDSRSYDDEDAGETYHDSLKGHTKNDKADMSRMGKVQELRRNYRPLSALAFTVIIQGTWEVLMTATYQGLVDGGAAGLIWSYIWTFFGFIFVVASLAEMASMAPTAGGQYHWVSEFAPPKYQKSMSYFIGVYDKCV
jgi:amino acid permease